LQSGICDQEKALLVAERLTAPDLFTGWGIRTLSHLSPAYNPMGYHVGSVWPHDNGVIAVGLRSLGRVDQALELAKGLIEMTLLQPHHRPPELFCGFQRTDPSQPVPYPVACSPQAWATGTIFQLLQMMIHLTADPSSHSPQIQDPVLPQPIHSLTLENLRMGSQVMDLQFGRDSSGGCSYTVQDHNTSQ
jgi:glycogen debranching enzyme